MKIVAAVSWFLAILMVVSGIIGYQAGSLISLITSLIGAIVFGITGWYCWIKVVSAGYLSTVLTFLLAIYFAYRFIASESIIPAGILLMVTFFALFFVLLGLFLGLKGTNGISGS